jgi:hypothetical protein
VADDAAGAGVRQPFPADCQHAGMWHLTILAWHLPRYLSIDLWCAVQAVDILLSYSYQIF